MLTALGTVIHSWGWNDPFCRVEQCAATCIKGCGLSHLLFWALDGRLGGGYAKIRAKISWEYLYSYLLWKKFFDLGVVQLQPYSMVEYKLQELYKSLRVFVAFLRKKIFILSPSFPADSSRDGKRWNGKFSERNNHIRTYFAYVMHHLLGLVRNDSMTWPHRQVSYKKQVRVCIHT